MARWITVAGIASGLAGIVVVLQFVFGAATLPDMISRFFQFGSSRSGTLVCPNPPAPVFIFQDSDKSLLHSVELKGLSGATLRIARNEIFARHGYRFATDALKTYFACQPWYHATMNDVSGQLSAVERQNLASIQQAEKRAPGN